MDKLDRADGKKIISPELRQDIVLGLGAALAVASILAVASLRDQKTTGDEQKTTLTEKGKKNLIDFSAVAGL